MTVIYIAQGEHAVGRRRDDVISTILGSCVSICLWDSMARVGGMNHMLLAERPDEACGTSGAAEIECLMNALLRHGASRDRMSAKVFGGSSMLAGMTDIGARNAAFASDWLEREKIAIDAQSTGGVRARQVHFMPESGRARQRFVVNRPPEMVVKSRALNDVELF